MKITWPCQNRLLTVSILHRNMVTTNRKINSSWLRGVTYPHHKAAGPRKPKRNQNKQSLNVMKIENETEHAELEFLEWVFKFGLGAVRIRPGNRTDSVGKRSNSMQFAAKKKAPTPKKSVEANRKPSRN